MARFASLLFVALVMLSVSAGCKSSGRHVERGGRPVVREDTLRGTVFYRERLRLPPNAMLQVKLVEEGRGRERPIAGRMIGPVRRTPIQFELPFDPRDIDDRRRYTLDATILVDRQPWMKTSQAVPCLTHGHPRQGIEVLVVRER